MQRLLFEAGSADMNEQMSRSSLCERVIRREVTQTEGLVLFQSNIPNDSREFSVNFKVLGFYARLQPNSSIFGLTKYNRQIVQYLVVFQISVFVIRLANGYIR